MTGRNRRDKGVDQPWEIEGVSQETQVIAAKAAADTGASLEIWLADTVLRATQEGPDAPEAKIFSATSRRTTP